jgi:hypothetical protein
MAMLILSAKKEPAFWSREASARRLVISLKRDDQNLLFAIVEVKQR